MNLVLIPFFIFLSYLFIRSYLFHIRKVESSAYIEKISLRYFGQKTVLPEALVTYKYYFQDGVYYNSHHMPLISFLDDPYYHISLDRNGFAVLKNFQETIISEERIEDYILRKKSRITIYFDPIEPYHSEIKNESYTAQKKVKVYA